MANRQRNFNAHESFILCRLVHANKIEEDVRTKRQSEREKAWDTVTAQFMAQVDWPNMTKDRLVKKWKNLKVGGFYLQRQCRSTMMRVLAVFLVVATKFQKLT